MGILLDRLNKKKVLVSDGAWGTMLQAKGLGGGDCPEQWNVTQPADVQSVAAAYARVGADLILTNTFGGSKPTLQKRGYGDRVVEFNEAGARNSLTGAAGTGAIVAGSVGPTGEFIAPLGTMTLEEMEEVFSEQISAILATGVRVICVETMSAVQEAACAIRAAKKLDAAVDVIGTMTFDDTPKGFRTMMGVTCEQAVRAMIEAGADVVGSNCGNGTAAMIGIAREFRRHTDKPILIHANAGVPELIDGKTCFRESPEEMAARVGELIEAIAPPRGMGIVGGCCGTTPEHIAAIRSTIDDWALTIGQ